MLTVHKNAEWVIPYLYREARKKRKLAGRIKAAMVALQRSINIKSK